MTYLSVTNPGPVEESVERFWRMVWEYEMPTVLMLTQCTEAGKVQRAIIYRTLKKEMQRKRDIMHTCKHDQKKIDPFVQSNTKN